MSAMFKAASSEEIMIRKEPDALILSFPQPVLTLSWAVLNGGFCRADHILNHQVHIGDAAFIADPELWLQKHIHRRKLRGRTVALVTGVAMTSLVEFSARHGAAEVTCFATVGCANALSAGDAASFNGDGMACPHTINMILLVRPGLRQEAMVEAVQIATEGRVRALYESGVLSSQSALPATGTGTDCVAVASLGELESRYCGKHTKLGELIGLASYTSVKKGVAASRHRSINSDRDGLARSRS
jgi:adenosylcobinamide hydrolase